MKRILLVSSLTILLSGCWMHSNDPRPPILRASVTTVNNNVCVMVSPQGDEHIEAVIIEEAGNDKNRSPKYGLNIPITNDECVTDFGYKFETGKDYNFSVILESPSKKKQGREPFARVFESGFTIQNDNGKLGITTRF